MLSTHKSWVNFDSWLSLGTPWRRCLCWYIGKWLLLKINCLEPLLWNRPGLHQSLVFSHHPPPMTTSWAWVNLVTESTTTHIEWCETESLRLQFQRSALKKQILGASCEANFTWTLRNRKPWLCLPWELLEAPRCNDPSCHHHHLLWRARCKKNRPQREEMGLLMVSNHEGPAYTRFNHYIINNPSHHHEPLSSLDQYWSTNINPSTSSINLLLTNHYIDLNSPWLNITHEDLTTLNIVKSSWSRHWWSSSWVRLLQCLGHPHAAARSCDSSCSIWET